MNQAVQTVQFDTIDKVVFAYTAFMAGLGSAQYANPMGATHDDVAPDYIKTFTDASTDSCMQQCLDLQAMTTTPHHSNIFCHQASDYGWEPSKPTWEVMMEVRCQIGIWKNYPENYVPHYDQNNRDLSWQHKPRWFYCNAGQWVNKEKSLYDLENSFAIKDNMAECTHLHGPFDFNDGCNIEKYDWFPGWYDCEYQPYQPSHQYYNAAVHGSYNRGEGGTVRSEEEARSIWGSDAGYLKVCKVQCPAPSVPREILADGSVGTITCDLRTGEWSPAPPQGCDEPFGRGHQCANPQSQSSDQFDWHGRWECQGAHGHTYEPKPSYSGYNSGYQPGYQPGYKPGYPSSQPYSGGYDPYGRKRRDVEHEGGEGEEGERGYYGSPSYPAPSYPQPSYPSSSYPSNYPQPSYSGTPYASNYQHYSAYNYSPPKKVYTKSLTYGYGYDASIHGQTHCHLTCDPGFVSSTCDTELTCDPTTWPSWGPDVNPPVCVPREMKACPRDCDFEPSVVENGMYLCTRLPGAWKTECVLQCQQGINHRGLSYVVEDTDMSILTCNSDDKWLNALGANGTITHCVEAASKCPTTAAEVDAMFDAGTGGSFDTNINGGIVDVTLKCEQGHRPEVYSKTTTRCYDGNWLSDITRCIEDKDYCLDGHPQLTTNTTDINGQWECTRTSVTGIEVVYSQDQRTELFDEAERSYGYDTNYNGYNQDHILSAQAKWTCRLICDQGFMVASDSTTTCTDYIGTSWDLSPFPVCEAKPVCDLPTEDVCTDWDCSKQFYNQNAIQGTYGNSQYKYHNYGYMPAKNSYWPEKFYASSPTYQQYYKPDSYGYVAGNQHPYHHLYSNINYNAGSMYYSNVYQTYNSYSSSSTTHTSTQHHYVGRRDVNDDPMDRWEWDDDIQEVQRCVPLCKDNCISVSGITAYHCFVETATWDAPPVRCCPDVHAIENANETCAIDLEVTGRNCLDNESRAILDN
ncbi:unnamed protein product [Oikopleura dioica]|uniref:Sushi domain-containing protein n=1 Tax=Oikopleura dioica TaxID=34765 RepID=E4YCR4_OIKDI|nr:unnamed protein product [Oikopleura dioica]